MLRTWLVAGTILAACTPPPASIDCLRDTDCDVSARCENSVCVRDEGDAGTLDAGPVQNDDAGPPQDSDAGPRCLDLDGDGFGEGCPAGPDCDDEHAAAYPGAAEICDLIDNDCDGEIDVGAGVAVCPCPIFVASSGTPYLLCADRRRFQPQAQDTCTGFGLEIAMPRVPADNGELRTAVGRDFWIGLRDPELDGSFVWDDGDALALEEESWRIGQPNNSSGNARCVIAGLLGWEDVECEDTHEAVVCQAAQAGVCVDNDGDGRGIGCAAGRDCDDNDGDRFGLRHRFVDGDGDGLVVALPSAECVGDGAPPIETGPANGPNELDCDDANDAVGSLPCPGCFVANDGSDDMRFCTQIAAQPDGKDACLTQFQSELVKLDTERRALFAKDYGYALNALVGGQQIYFIGGEDPDADNVDYLWPDGEVFSFEDFKSGRPDQTNQQCVGLELGNDGGWNDLNCTDTRRFICD